MPPPALTIIRKRVFDGHAALTGLDRHIVVGTLKGYDQLMNLVLDDVRETLRGEQEGRLHPL